MHMPIHACVHMSVHMTIHACTQLSVRMPMRMSMHMSARILPVHGRSQGASAHTRPRIHGRAYTAARPRIHALAHTRTMKAIKDAHARELAELRAKLAASERAREDTVPRPFCSRMV